MKKLISILLVLCLSLSVMAAMTACSGGNEPENNGGENGGENNNVGGAHQHSFKSEWVKN